MRDRLSWLSLAMALACAPVSADETTVPEIRPGVLQGYLSKEALPDSAALLPPPPAVGSAAAALDQEVAKANLAFRDTLRWRLAAMDANLSFPDAAGDFSCALGAPVTIEDTPRLYQMLRRVGSYPSGHASIGWAWALVLAEASSSEAQAILARGRAFGESRLVCNVHWASDVIEGRFIGAATVARLHAEPQFLADLAAARGELEAVRGRHLLPQRDCNFEAEALAETPPQSP